MRKHRTEGAPTRESESATDLGLRNKEGQGGPQHSWGASPPPPRPARGLLFLVLMTHRVGAHNWDLSRG